MKVKLIKALLQDPEEILTSQGRDLMIGLVRIGQIIIIKDPLRPDEMIEKSALDMIIGRLSNFNRDPIQLQIKDLSDLRIDPSLNFVRQVILVRVLSPFH